MDELTARQERRGAMAQKHKEQGMEDFATAYKALFFDLPLAGVKWGLGLGGEKETRKKAWQGYDATVRLATGNIDNLYRTPVFGEVMARSVDVIMRWQRVRSAMTGAFFAGMWQAVGLPTAEEVRALRSEVQGLREEVRTQRVGIQVKRKEAQAPAQWHRSRKAPQRTISGNGRVKGGDEGIDIEQAKAA